MAGYRRRNKQKNDGDDQLGVEMIFNQPKVDECTSQYTHDAECRAFRSGVSACIHIWQAHKAECRNSAEKNPSAD